MSKFTQKHTQLSFCSKLKEQKCYKIWKKAIRKTEIWKNTSKKSKQHASLHEKRKSTSLNLRKNHKVGKTEAESS